jgi:endoglucanase
MKNGLGLRRFRCSEMTLVITFLLAFCPAAVAQTLKGVNFASPAFFPSRLPGVYGQDFVYPNEREIEYFIDKGMNVFRISILWERLQPTLNGPLDPGELERLVGFIKDVDQRGGSTIIDIHNYGGYRGITVGQSPVTDAAFADLWTRLALRFGQDDHVIFGLMNEPQVPQASLWQQAVQKAIDGIRGTGARNRIFVSGIAWDGAEHFAEISGKSLSALADPQHRLIFEVHAYFDADASGTSDTCISPRQAVARLTAFTQWLRAGKRRGFLGEFGVSRRPECLMVLKNVASYLQENADVWLGWTYWAAGPGWGNYMFTIEPKAGTDRPQMLVLESFLHSSS